MMQTGQPKRKRRRGVILTPKGLERFQQAKSNAEFEENAGHRYTLEALSERTGLAVDTLMKMLACEAGVDKQTLKVGFRAFKLTLEASDYFHPDAQEGESEGSEGEESGLQVPDVPGGQVPLDSTFYVERAIIEAECYKTVLQPGGLIRIKAPRRMGKRR